MTDQEILDKLLALYQDAQHKLDGMAPLLRELMRHQVDARPAPIRTRAYLHAATEPRGKPEPWRQIANDAGELFCPNEACPVRDIPIENAKHYSAIGLFFCPQCGRLLETPPATGADPEPAPVAAPAHCTACGWRGLASASDCPECGAIALVADRQPPELDEGSK